MTDVRFVPKADINLDNVVMRRDRPRPGRVAISRCLQFDH